MALGNRGDNHSAAYTFMECAEREDLESGQYFIFFRDTGFPRKEFTVDGSVIVVAPLSDLYPAGYVYSEADIVIGIFIQ